MSGGAESLSTQFWKKGKTFLKSPPKIDEIANVAYLPEEEEEERERKRRNSSKKQFISYIRTEIKKKFQERRLWELLPSCGEDN